MKPRLTGPLTEEDGNIWLELAHTWPFGAKQRMLDNYMLSDVRDADLMLALVNNRPRCVGIDDSHQLRLQVKEWDYFAVRP